jgi:hypothetical protein
MTRKEANMEIIRLLVNCINMAPDQRFGQLLRNTGVIIDRMESGDNSPKWMNHFNEEPQAMLERMKKEIAKWNTL